MIRKTEFIKVRNDFQDKLKQDLETIRYSKNVLYELLKESNEKLLHDSIRQTYKKTPVNTKRNINRESKKFAKNLSLERKMECYSDNHACITLKITKKILEITSNVD